MTKASFTLFTGKSTVAKGYDLIDHAVSKVVAEPFYQGSFETLSTSTEDLEGIIKSLKPGQFLTAGTHKALRFGTCPKDATRTVDDFPLQVGAGLLILDGDSLEDPCFKINSTDDYVIKIAKLDKELASSAIICSPSASSGITFAGKDSGLRGLHCFIPVDQAKEIPRILDILHKRSVLSGWARPQITATGTILIKSLVDLAMKSSNQPCFEGGARLLNNAITQQREVVTYDGEVMCTDNIKELTEKEESEYEKACLALKSSVQVDADAIRSTWLAYRENQMVLAGATIDQAKLTLERALNGGDLFSNFTIHTDKLGSVTVAEILSNPSKYHGQTCADPIDPDYGQNKAKIYSDQDKPVIHSLAHGGVGCYFLQNDPSFYFDGDDVNLQHSRSDLAEMINATSDFDELTKRIAKLICSCDLNESERDSLRKLIAKKASVSLSSLKADAKLFEAENNDGSNRLDHLQAARSVIASHGGGNLLGSSGFLWLWRGDGVWRRVDDRETKQVIHEVARASSLTANVVGSVLDMVKTEAYLPGHQFDLNPKSINCVNGELVYKNGQWQLDPHERSHYRTAMLPVAYDPGATAPRFEQFLAEVFKGDSDHVQKSHVVCEALGYTLIPSCHLEKFFMLIGSGANGKSVLLSVLADLIGREYTTAVQPSQFENRFQRGHLQGKLANIITEIAEGAEIADAQLKSLVSGEMTTAEHKHQAPFDFVPYAKHWFGTNHLPHTRDFSDALFRRALILTFPNKFDGPGRDVHLIDKLKAELPGILNLALEGLQRLISNSAFTECPSSADIAKQWRREADQVAQFVEEDCETGAGFEIASSQLFEKYGYWAARSGVKRTLNHNNFTNRLTRLGFEKSKGTGGTRMIFGLKQRQFETGGTNWIV